MDKDRAVAELRTFFTAYDAVDAAKHELGISIHNSLLGDDDIRAICCWVAKQSPDTIEEEDGGLLLMPLGIGIILSVLVMAFPQFYEKYELSQCN